MKRALTAFPGLLRVGFASALAYRAEFLVWVLAYTTPLIMLALWTAVAAEAPVGRFREHDFAAYFTGTLLVRLASLAATGDTCGELLLKGPPREIGEVVHPAHASLTAKEAASGIPYCSACASIAGLRARSGTRTVVGNRA